MDSAGEIDHSEIQSALGSIGLSALLILGATFLSQGLGFLTRVTMTRYLPVDGYGNIVVGLSVLNTVGIAALVGMPAALSRYLPRQDTEDDRLVVLSSAFHIVFITSTFIAILMYSFAGTIANSVFGNDDIVNIIRIFAGALPFYTILKTSFGGFRGYEKTYPRILAQNILRPGLQLIGIVIFVTVGYGTVGIAFAYVGAFVFVAIVAVYLLYQVIEISLNDIIKSREILNYKRLLTFSVPLAASGAIGTITKHSDIILLGYYKSSADVGVYEIAFRMAILVALLVRPAVGYLFQPIVSRFHANSDLNMMASMYTISTRWVVFATFPAFSLLFLFPEQTLSTLFGDEYTGGKLALQILLFAGMLSLMTGLTNNMLTASGDTKILMYISIATMSLNVIVNIALIPIFGIIGAAIATAIARVFNNFTQLFFIYHIYEMHPFRRNYVIPTILLSVVFLLLFFAPLPFQLLSFIEGIIIAGTLGLLYFILLLITRSIYPVELKLVDDFLERIGISVSISKRFEMFTR